MAAILETDANTVAHWRFDSDSEVLDLSGGANHVTDFGETTASSSVWGAAVDLPGGHGLEDGDPLGYTPFQAQAVSDALHTALTSKTWAIDFLFRVHSLPGGSNQYMLLLGYGDEDADSWPVTIRVADITGNENVVQPGNTGRGYSAVGGISDGTGRDQTVHVERFLVLTVRCFITSGSAYQYDAWANGIYRGDTSTSTVAVPAPAKADCKVTFGHGDRAGTVANGYQFDGDLVEVRIRSNTPTPEEIYDYHWDAITQAVPDQSPPAISNVLPVEGSSIGRNEAWSGRVTDDVGFRHIMLWVKLTDSAGNERGREVIWDGTEFAALYSTLSTRTEVTAGLVYDFSIRRNGGWPYSPTIYATAIDTAGNEAA